MMKKPSLGQSRARQLSSEVGDPLRGDPIRHDQIRYRLPKAADIAPLRLQRGNAPGISAWSQSRMPSSGTAEALQIDVLRVYLAHVAYISRRANIVGGSTPPILRSICSILLNLA